MLGAQAGDYHHFHQDECWPQVRFHIVEGNEEIPHTKDRNRGALKIEIPLNR